MKIPTTPWNVLDSSLDRLATVTAALSKDDLSRPTPCSDWNVMQVLQHAAGDQVGYASVLTGGPGPTYNPFDPSGDLAVDIRALVDDSIQTSAAAWSGVAADSGPIETPLPVGPLAAEIGAAACGLDAAVHAWDVAVATGQPSPLDDELSAALLDAAHSFVEPLRAFAYAPALPAQPGDTATDALLRYLGRDPKWSNES